ncbi:MAG TPA: sulfocyanin-like copper-binding protein [Gemmatimonadales bacterium]|nr:sulfocyanin-like copper-binding protein [Gemmatimonadales bacterium]
MRSMVEMAGLFLVPMLPLQPQRGTPTETARSLAPAVQSDSANKWVSYDAATNTVTFELEAGAPGGAGPFNFDGYSSGKATLVVPPGSSVIMNFVNHDATPHSAEIIADQDPMPNMGGDPAISGAYTDDLTQGMPEFGTDVIRFTAPASGSYRIFCGVPGHGLSGMWIRFRVDPAAKTATLVTS